MQTEIRFGTTRSFITKKLSHRQWTCKLLEWGLILGHTTLANRQFKTDAQITADARKIQRKSKKDGSPAEKNVKLEDKCVSRSQEGSQKGMFMRAWILSK